MSNKIALVTGSSRGLGKDMALRLAEKGADVIITYNSQKQMAEAVVKQIEGMGRKSMLLPFDAGNFTVLPDFVKLVEKTLKDNWNTGKFDFLINNAGIGATIPIEKVTEFEFDRMVNIQFKSVFFLCQKLLPVINNGGRVINISSGSTRFGVPGYAVYASMKGAIEVFTRYLAKEIGTRGITANVVAPGAIETDFNNATLRNAPPERRNMIIANTPLGRLGRADDIGGVVAFLCSEDAGWINGQRIEVSGGINL